MTRPKNSKTPPPMVKVTFTQVPGKGTILSLQGRLEVTTTGKVWRQVMQYLDKNPSRYLEVDAREVMYCDGSGVGLFIELHRRLLAAGGICEIKGLHEKFQRHLDVFLGEKIFPPAQKKMPRGNYLETFGKAVAVWLADCYRQLSFLGELAVHMISVLKHPGKCLRWHDIGSIIESQGVGAVFIVALINFLMGLIMAFQAAIPMRQFGADIYVADLVSLAILRVLGPLMTAVILTGRTASAFAAELGTMKINEEIDALNTMGINPVRFLVINRVAAVFLLMPVLTIFADFFGIAGGAVVVRSLGYPLITYLNRIMGIVRLTDFLGGFVKSFVFSIIISMIGCYRGLQTTYGAYSVGQAATIAVVQGLIVLILTEGIFAVTYYYLGI